MKCQVKLIAHVMSNAIDNAKMHGLAKAEIFLYVDYNGTHLMLQLINKPGENHQEALERQAALGTGFMFAEENNVLTGRPSSTFLVRPDICPLLSIFLGPMSVTCCRV